MIDAHIHLWDTQRLNYDWLKQVPVINRNFLPADYDLALAGETIDAMVFVQCECRPEQHLQELAWVRSLVESEPRLQAIIPWAPLEDGDGVAKELEKMAADPLIKGVRRIIEFEEDIDFCVQPGFIRGIELLGQFDLHCELTIGPRNFPNVMKIIDNCPNTRFILDHIGCPPIIKGELEPWRSGIKAFAASGPHSCKFSNFVCNADLEKWTIDDLRPYAEVVLETFGEDRIIWGSDWPHCLRASSFARWLDTARQLTQHLSASAQAKIFHSNAAEFYKISV